MASISQIVFGVGASLGLGLMALGAPGGRFMVGQPSVEKATRDPSVRTGSSHGHHWFVVGGGYHGGK